MEEEETPGATGVSPGPHPPSGNSDINEGDLLSGYSVMSMSSLPEPQSDPFVVGSTSSGDASCTSHTASPHSMFQSYADIGTSILRPAPPEEDTPPLPQAEAGNGVLRSVLMIIPLRLGNERFNPSYWEGLKVMHTHTHTRTHTHLSVVLMSLHYPEMP